MGLAYLREGAMALLSTPSAIVAHRFLIAELAGSGGMGSVYKARDLLTGQLVALKILHGATPTPQDAERFAREARLLATLEHPNIVRYVAHGQTSEGQPFLAMDWLDGHELTHHLEHHQLTLAESLLVTRQVASALCLAHRRSIVHRDIKPSNLFLRSGHVGRVVLLDFGIARDGQLSRAVTRTGALVGTPGYMAPEQARGRQELSPSADIFSLGCVLFECLTGRPPFVGEHLEQILLQILYQPEPSLRSLRPEMPEALEQLLAQMLNKDATARLPHAMALLEALESLKMADTARTASGSRSDSNHQLTPLPIEALSSAEQQLVCVILARTSDVAEAQTTLNPQQAEEARKPLVTAAELLAPLHVQAELLSDGTLVGALLLGHGETAGELAQRAARAGLLIRANCPGVVVAVSMGRGTLDGMLPVGEALNRAIRLSHARQVAKEGKSEFVTIDIVTADLLSQRFCTVPLDSESVALLGEEPLVDAMPLLLGRATPCTGRESELGQLEALLMACIDESVPRAILVLAPTGLGKSRLRHEFIRRLESAHRDYLVIYAEGEPLTAGLSYEMLRRALDRLSELGPDDPLTPQRQRLWAQLGPDRPDESVREPFLTWLRAECAARPVIFVLENLQWAHSSTVWLFDLALRELSDSPLLVLALGRPEVNELFPRLWQGRVQFLPLRPLGRRASDQLARSVLGNKLSAEAIARLVDRAAGNPRYLEELIRSAGEGHGDETPGTVLAMLQARLCHVDAEARQTLRAASIFGERCWSGGVASLLGVPRSEAERSLSHLVREELLDQPSESRFAGEIEYCFRHGLLREAVYSTLTDGDRLLGHRLAGMFLQRHGARPDELAHHFVEAGAVEQALHQVVAAAQSAAASGLPADERRYQIQARQLLSRLPESPQLWPLQLELRLRQIENGLTHEPLAVQLERLTELRALLESHADQTPEQLRRMAAIEACSGQVYHYGGRPNEAIRYLRKVRPLTDELGQPELALSASLSIGGALCMQGRFKAAQERLEWVLGPVEQLGQRAEWLRGYGYYVTSLAAIGRAAEARSQAEKGLQAALLSEHAPTATRFRTMLAMVHVMSGDWPATIAEAQALLPMAEKLGDRLYIYAALDLLAWAEGKLGLHDAAFMHRSRSRELRRAVGGGLFADWMNAVDGELLLSCGRVQEALEQARAVVALAEPSGLLFSQAIGHRVWGAALAELGGDPGDVDCHFQAALARCNFGEAQQVVNAAFTELVWGEVLELRGDRAGAALHRERGVAALEAAGCDVAASHARQGNSL